MVGRVLCRPGLRVWVAGSVFCLLAAACGAAGQSVSAGSTAASLPPTTARPITTLPPTAADTSAPTTGAATSSVTTTAPPPSTTPSLPTWWRAVTTDAPLRVWVIGDSLAGPVGSALRALGGESGLVEVTVHSEGGSGLAQLEVLDWPAFLTDNPPPGVLDAVVVILGANDGQGMAAAEGWAAFGTPEWDDRYAALVGGLIGQLLGGASRVYWVGLPAMADPDYDARMQHVSTLIQNETVKRLEARYIEARSLFTDAAGRYAAALPIGEGAVVTLRAADGIHFTSAGAGVLAERILEVLGSEWGW